MTDLSTFADVDVDPTGAAVVAGTALVGWLAAVTAAGGWGEPVIVVWALIMFLFAGLVLLLTGPE